MLDRIINGYPRDYHYSGRFLHYILKRLPPIIASWLTEREIDRFFDHSRYGIKPAFGCSKATGGATINGFLPNQIINGRVKMMPDIRRFGPHSVEFVDGSVEEVDAIVYATGFELSYPYVDCPLFSVNGGNMYLYKQVFAPDLQPQTAAVIACVGVNGSVFTSAEMQCRLAAKVFAVKLLLFYWHLLPYNVKLVQQFVDVLY